MQLRIKYGGDQVKIIDLDGIKKKSQATILVERLIFSSENIEDCYINESKGHIMVSIKNPNEMEIFSRVLQKILDETKQHKPFPRRIIKTNINSTNFLKPNEYKKTSNKSGRVYLKDVEYMLFNALSDYFIKFALTKKAILRRYPSTILRSTLDKCNYIKSFPQNIMMVSSFPHNDMVLQEVKSTKEYTGLLKTSDYALSPAVCFHCYEEWQGSVLDTPLILTAQGSCFRNEASWRLDNHRLKEFQMSEIVVIGNENEVETFRTEVIENIWGFFTKIGLTGYVESAHDPFYYNEDTAKLQYQLIGNMKYELVVRNRNDQEYSIASFNNMGNSLCKIFNIRSKTGDYLSSGCIAFGIERWVHAILTYFGDNSSKWPSSLKVALNI